ncbi:T9SS type A sorting domain-containing protein [Flavobacterium sp. N1994]|uniref:T9SS type A sorting domain-containing protein n=1 Tax=Flavobacterium sp. N1994 TaxID=2986827 RepID=UPI0022227372|nr:T9SS type A sorting domain-containing protein [Flavobacterium sp. N1994]
MSKLYFFIAFAFTGLVSSAQTITIPDTNFKAKLLQASTTNYIATDFSNNSIKIDINDDGEIQLNEVLGVEDLNLDSCNISSFEGIQNFSNLTVLRCSDNLMSELNLCGTSVFYLFCDNAPNLTTINLKNNVISQTAWQEPPFPPFFVWNLPSLQYICADAAEMAEVYGYFSTTTTNTLTYSSDCDTTNCSSLLTTLNQVRNSVISIYPNPATTVLNIKLDAEIKSVSIYNTLGQIVQEHLSSNKTIDVSVLKTGSYFIKIISDKGTVSSKFIKE